MYDPRPGRSDAGNRERSREEYDAVDMRWVSGFVALVGIWIALSPVLYAPNVLAVWNNLIVGGAIAVVAGAGFMLVWQRDVVDVAAAAFVAILGLWTVAAPLFVPFGAPGLLWSNVGAGGLVALVAGYNAYAIGEGRVFERPGIV